MVGTIVIPARFNGPMGSGNGGYSAGAVASLLNGAVKVTLRRPVPLDRPLEAIVEHGSEARLLDRGELVAEAVRVEDFSLEVPAAVSVDEARAAMSRYRGQPEGPFSHCFVCGRARQDALGVFAGPVEGRSVVASTWTPDPADADAEGSVPAELVWAVLDCPTYFAAYAEEERTVSFLARFTARVDRPVQAGAEHVVIAWPIDVEGRKRRAGSAVLSADGEVLARAAALLIEPR